MIRRVHVLWGVALAALAVGLLGAGGCKQSETAASNGAAPAGATASGETTSPAGQTPRGQTDQAPTARAVLENMVSAYQRAGAYADKGTIRLQAKEGDQPVDQSAEYSVVFARPNKIRMRVYEGVMVSNGAEMSAFANHVPNQVVKRPAPAQISIHTLFADEMFGGAISGAVSQAPTQSFSWVPVQLLLLLADDPLKTLLHQSDEPVLLDPARIDEHECLRVELARPDGKATLWIDRQSHLLRRLQFPVDEMLKQIPAEKKVRGLTLSADFVDARFQDQVDESAFRFEIPSDARVLETLMPPAMLLVGHRAPEFSFTGPDGKPIDLPSLRGKVVVLDFWATWCGPCRVKLPLVEKVYAKYKGHEKVAFVAVSVDRPETPDKDLQSVFRELNVTLPVARDPQQDAGKKFFVEAIPASCILGPDGVVQDFQAGFRPTHDTDLAAKIEKLLAGKSIQEQPLGQLQEERKLYAAWLDKWVKEGLFLPPSPDDQEVPKTEIAPRSDPKRFTLAPLWKCPDLKSPGNLLVVADPAGPPRLYVLDAWRTVAELGSDGHVVAPHALDIPERQAATFLRTFGNGTRRWFVVSGAMQQQVHLFDEQWKKLVSFPEDAPEHPHAGIADALLADLDGDGSPEIYVGYFGEVGVHAVSLEGKRLWANRSLSMVSRLAALGRGAEGHGSLLCTNALGSLVALDHQGKRLDEYRVPNRLIHWLVGADLERGKSPMLAGLYLADFASSVAIGLGPKGEELWTYPLPKGIHQWPIEQIIPARLSAEGPGQWLFPAADGSIHILAADGKPLDQFHYGEALTGMGTMLVDGQPVLVVATTKAVEAWKIGSAAGKN